MWTNTKKRRLVMNDNKFIQLNKKSISDEIFSSTIDPTIKTDIDLDEENDYILFMVEYHRNYYKGWDMNKFI